MGEHDWSRLLEHLEGEHDWSRATGGVYVMQNVTNIQRSRLR